jgi:predicted transcriptional regulator
MKHPQEIEVWYIMPAIRKELCNILLYNHNFNQKEIAKLLNITEAAVSQYKKEKRGQHVKLPKSVLFEINISAEKIVNTESTVFRETQNILNHIRDTSTICDIHKMMDNSVESDCEECILHQK